MSHVSPIRASVKDAITEIAATLEVDKRVSFEELCAGHRGRIAVVVRFLALLELFKAGAIEIEQATRFGDISASWTGEVDAQEVLEDAEEYTLIEAPPASKQLEGENR